MTLLTSGDMTLWLSSPPMMRSVAVSKSLQREGEMGERRGNDEMARMPDRGMK